MFPLFNPLGKQSPASAAKLPKLSHPLMGYLSTLMSFSYMSDCLSALLNVWCIVFMCVVYGYVSLGLLSSSLSACQHPVNLASDIKSTSLKPRVFQRWKPSIIKEILKWLQALGFWQDSAVTITWLLQEHLQTRSAIYRNCSYRQNPEINLPSLGMSSCNERWIEAKWKTVLKKSERGRRCSGLHTAESCGKLAVH